MCSAARRAVRGDLGPKSGRVFVQRPKRGWQWLEPSPGRAVVPWKQRGDKTLRTEEPNSGSLLTVQVGRRLYAPSTVRAMVVARASVMGGIRKREKVIPNEGTGEAA